MYIFKLIFF